MEIYLEQGVGVIKFGMKPSEIEKLLGEPDKITVNKDDANKIIWIFNKEKLRLTFYESENKKLGYIESANKELILNNKKIIGKDVKFIKDKILNNAVLNWEKDEYHSFTRHFNEKYWITLHEEYGEVTEIEFGVPFLNNEEYKWP